MDDERDDFERDFETHFNNSSAGEYMMVNSLTHIAKDLDRLLIGIFVCAGLLACIAFMLFLRFIGY